MSWMMHDLICKECGEQEHEAMYKRADGPPDCPNCDKTFSIDIRGMRFHIHGHGHGSFTPVDFGVMGKAETKEDYDRCIKTIETRFPGHSVNIEGESTKQREVRLDSIRHRSYETKKAKGFDANMTKEWKAERKAVRTEARKTAKAQSNKTPKLKVAGKAS